MSYKPFHCPFTDLWYTVKFEHIREEQYTLEIPDIKMDKVYLPVHIKKTYKYVSCKCILRSYPKNPAHSYTREQRIAYAYCSKKDQYSKKIGRELSFDRAIKVFRMTEDQKSLLRRIWNLQPIDI